MSRRKILLIDDEESFTDMVKFNLEETGRYDVAVENAGSQALVAALSFRPDLILLDIIMPDMEGSEVFAQLQKHPELSAVPVIFFTAAITPEEVRSEKGLVGGHTFLAKPGSLEELIACIENALAP